MNPIFKNVSFGDIRTFDDLGLILVDQDVQPAEPKLNLIEVPGANGSIDLTEALGVGIKYNDRVIEWSFAVNPKCDMERKSSEVSGLLNGRRFEITIAGDEEHYFNGRVSVQSHNTGRKVRTIKIRAVCAPYKLHKVAKKITKTVSTTEQTITLINDRMPVAPTIAATGGDIRVILGTESAIFEAGTVRIDPAITLQPGINELKIKAMDSSATSIAFEWREGAL